MRVVLARLAVAALVSGCARHESSSTGQAAQSGAPLLVPPTASVAPADTCPPLHADLPALPTIGDDAIVPPIEDDSATMAPFFETLARVVRGTATEPVRIVVYGDSNGTMDFMTGEMRRVLQTKYGDAGHGFVATGRPWNWYRHRYVRHDSIKGEWEPFTVTTKPTRDGFYGFGMIVGESLQNGADTWVETAEDGAPIGTRASSFDISFLKWPRGGPFDVKVDGHVVTNVDSYAKKPEAGFFRVEVPDGPHKLDIVARSFHTVRIFGVALGRPGGGVQVDGVGVGSLNCLTMLRDDAEIDRATLARRGYDLVVFHIGSNTFVAGDLGVCMKQVIARQRAALPGVPVLLMTPPDFLGQLHPPKTVGWLVQVCDAMRAMAKDDGAAFFDFRAAMGGDGSIAKFQDAGMTQGDYTHFNEKGGIYMGDRVVSAILTAFDRYAEAHPLAGCP
jgi:hypothetical protein